MATLVLKPIVNFRFVRFIFISLKLKIFNLTYGPNLREYYTPDPKNSELKERIKAHFGNFKDSVIYTVGLKGCKDHNAIHTAFSRAKSTKKEQRKYSSHNHKRSGLLYVGSSQSKYLVKRMGNHLGIGAKKVYSMHIKAWLPPNLRCTVVIRVLQVKIPDNTINSVKIIELIEKGLWDVNKPLFGKRSGLL